ncbi:MAG TPA: hypothetical protein VMT76_15210 [Puia sp.]|nr:hypothetical protein [Puia sp.]
MHQSIQSSTLLYYNDSAVTTGMIITNFNPALFTIDGKVSQSSVGFSYSRWMQQGK